MWDAEVYPLSLLIAVFSGVWPYLKIIMMLVSETVRPAQLTNTPRPTDSTQTRPRADPTAKPFRRERGGPPRACSGAIAASAS